MRIKRNRFSMILIIGILISSLVSCNNQNNARTIEDEEIPLGVGEIQDEIVFVSDIVMLNGSKSGIVNWPLPGLNEDELDVSSPRVYLTELYLEDGSMLSFVEPETDKVERYTRISTSSIIAVLLTNPEGEQEVIKSYDENLKDYKIMLLKEKRAVQMVLLTNLEFLLINTNLEGEYEVFLINEDNSLTSIRTAKAYYHKIQNYMLILSKNKNGLEYFRVDANVDLIFDHYYEAESETLDIKSFITSDNLEEVIYQTFMKMKVENLIELEVDTQSGKILVKINK